jgi:hypothetical protein
VAKFLVEQAHKIKEGIEELAEPPENEPQRRR